MFTAFSSTNGKWFKVTVSWGEKSIGNLHYKQVTAENQVAFFDRTNSFRSWILWESY